MKPKEKKLTREARLRRALSAANAELATLRAAMRKENEQVSALAVALWPFIEEDVRRAAEEEAEQVYDNHA